MTTPSDFLEGGKTRNPILLVIVIALIIAAVAWGTHPLNEPKSHKILTNEIENAESFYQEAKALSLSMPLLSDSLLVVTVDSIETTLIELNKIWICFVKTEEDFSQYSSTIQRLNQNLQSLQVTYLTHITIRGVQQFLEEGRKLFKREEKKTETYTL